MYKFLFGVFTCFVAVSSVISQSSTGPFIRAISDNQTKVNQGPADFFCKVENIAGYDVLWKRTNQNVGSEAELISTNTTVNISDNRFSVIFSDVTSSFNLHLDDIRPNDEGTYICEIPINSTYRVEKTTLLELNAVPQFFPNSSSSQITVNETEDVKIECYAGGSPPPDVSIMRDNGAPLRENLPFFRGNVLVIENITKREGGKYRCLANSSAGLVPKYIQIDVQAAPIIGSCSLTVNYYPDFNVALQCSIESHVTPDIVWFENGRKYSASESGANFESMITSDGRLFTAMLKTNSTLEINNSYYSIRAKNPLGESQAIVGQFSSIPRCPDGECPEPDCPLFNISFGTIFLLMIIAIIFGVWYMFKRREFHSIKNFQWFMPLTLRR